MCPRSPAVHDPRRRARGPGRHRQPGAQRRRTSSAAGSRRSEPEVAYQFVRDGDVGVAVTWGQVREQVYASSPPGSSPSVSRPRTASPSPPPPATSGPLADLAVMCAGAATTTIYPTTIADDVSYILSDSGSTVVFAEDDAQVDKLREIRAADPARAPGSSRSTASPDGDWVISLRDARGLRRASCSTTDPGVVDERIDALDARAAGHDHLHLGHDRPPQGRAPAPTTPGPTRRAAVDAIDILTKDDLQYLWLPLAHVFGKVLLTLPLQIGFPTAIDGRIDKIVDNLAVVKPTFMGAAPAHLREGPRPDHDDDGGGGRPQGEAVPLGHRRRAPRPRALREQGKEPERAARARSTPWPTSSCCTRSASASAAGSASSSPARPPSTRTSPAGSTAWACSSSRATA